VISGGALNAITIRVDVISIHAMAKTVEEAHCVAGFALSGSGDISVGQIGYINTS
jgi:hypothetical protein